MTTMTYNAIPSSDIKALGFHNLVAGDVSTTAWADLVSYFLMKAEDRFGPRDERWFFTGIAFTKNGPNIYHPGDRPFHVGIHLSTPAAANPALAYYQLAHEVVHLLGPNQKQLQATYLEEGMCTAFQLEMRDAAGITNTGELGGYQEALDLFKNLEETDIDAVKKLRARSRDLRLIDAATLVEVLPAVPVELASALSRTASLR